MAVLLLFGGKAYSQITCAQTTINNYVATICGPGITFSNVTLTGNANSIAQFGGGISGGLGATMNSGVVMSSGYVNTATALNGPASGFSSSTTGTAGITQLNTIAGATTNDGIILEFDFVPITNQISVNFQFGSEEYNEYVNSGYNDAFAFLISGPGIVGSPNIAVVPGVGTPVTIDNINRGNAFGCGVGCTNCAYYNDNCNGTFNNIMDGFTTMLTATRTVIPCSTYHIRLMLADGGDSSFDSWVFVQENGLYAAGNPPLTTTATYPFGTSTFEECNNSFLTFTIPAAQANPYSFNVVWSGTATSGVDYNPLPTTITIPAGQTTVNIPITVLADNITEGTETIICTYPYSVCSTAVVTMLIADSQPMTANAGPDQGICAGASATLSATSANGNGTITYTWSNGGGTGQSITVSPATTTTYTVTATDQCGRTATDQVTVTVSPPPTSTFTVTSPVCQGQNATVTYTGTAPAGATYTWNFGGANVVSGSGAGPYVLNWTNAGFPNVSLSVASGSCSSAVTTHTVTVNPNPTVDAGNDLVICQGTQVTVNGTGPAGMTESWSNGISEGVPFTPPVGVNTYTFTGTVTATGCSASDQVTVTVNPNPVVNAGADQTVCQGTAVTLSGSGALSYTWPAPITNNTPVVLAPGVYTITMIGTDANTCQGTDQVVVTVNPTPAAPVLNSNGPLCAGATLNLMASTGTGINWSGPNGFTSTLQNPVIPNVTTAASGNYSAYVVVSGCTSATANLNVTVNPTPATPVLGSNSPVCSGQALNLTSNVATGMNWSGPNSFTSTVQNPTIANATTAASGTYSGYAVALGCTSATATVNVVVNPTPATPVAAGNSPLCSGATLNLTSTVGSGNNWTGPNGFTSTAQNPTITNITTAASGTYSVYAAALGCTSATATVNIVVNPTPATPVLGSNSPVCSGQILNLTSNVATGMNWTGPNSFTSTVQNPTIANATTAASGTYSAYSVALGCTSATATVNVVVNPTPATPVAAGNSPLCSGATLNLTSTVGSGNNWTGPNGFTSTAQNPTITNITTAASGTYSVYAAALGCTSATATVNIVVNPTPATPVLGSNSPVCSGQALNLTSNVATGMNWSGPNSFTSTVQNPTITNVTTAASGTYSGYAVALGCTSATATVNVVVNPTPATPVAAGNSPLCSGATLNLTSTVGSGNNWTGPNGFTSTAQNPTITNITTAASGTYSVYAAALGCTSATATVNIVVNPTPATPVLGSNSPVCSGQALNLTSNVATGMNWTGPNSFTSTVQNPTIANATTAASGTYSGYAVALGCTSATATVNVVVNPTPATPVAAGNSPLCSGATLNLTSTVGSGNNWTGPNGFTSTAQNPTITNITTAASGTYSVYAAALGCTSATATVNIVVNPTPATPVPGSNSPVCEGQTLNLTSNAVSGNNWTGPNGFTSTAQNPSVANATPAATGTYSVYTVALGCTSATATINVTVTPLPATPVLGSNSPVCEGFAINLTSSAAAGNNWTGPNGFTSTAQNPVINPATMAASGIYTAYAVANGCTSATAAVPVLVNAVPAAPVAANTGPVCEGSPVTMSSDVANGIHWSGPNGFTSQAQNYTIPATGMTDAGMYSAYVVQNGCTSATANTQLVINAIPATPQASNNGPLCEGSTLNVEAGTIAGVQYVWSGPNGFGSNQEDNSLAGATTAASGTYSVYVVANGCTSGTATTNAVVNAIPAAPVISSNSPVCEGSAINLNGQTISGAAYVWSGPNGYTSPLEDPVILNATSAQQGAYSLYVVVNGCTSATSPLNVVILSASSGLVSATICQGETYNFGGNNYGNSGQYQLVFSNQFGCDSIITLQLTVTPAPEADFSAPVNVSLGEPVANIYDNSDYAASLVYYLNGSTFHTPDFSYTFSQEGIYPVTQVVSNGNCVDSLTQLITVNPYTNIFIPNAFTPGEDNLNEEFKAVASYLENFHMYIFDRWGELIFESDDVYKGWNGGMRNDLSKPVKSDTYVYKIRYKEYKGQEKEVIGHVNLLR